jgi:hypothetical protein
VRRVAFVIGVVAVAVLALSGGPGRASLYCPEEQMAIPVEDGKPVALPFEEFKRRLTVLLNAMVEPKPGEPDNPDRKKILDRIAERKKAKRLPSDETAALATDLLRVGRADEALDKLIAKSRPANYWVFTGLGHVYAARGDWVDAIQQQDAARLDAEMPETVKGLTKAQRDWWQMLDRDYLPHYYQISKQYLDSRRGLTPAQLEEANRTEEPTPLFPLPERGKSHSPVRFVDDAGVYQPGALAAAEKAKLPPDALAIVQQLLLWFPGDVRLYWLLAELYAAADDLDDAVVIFDECTWSRRYGNRQVLRDHRVAVHAAIEARPKPEPPAPPPEPPITMKTVLIYFGAIGVVGVLALVRAMFRRGKAGRTRPEVTPAPRPPGP